MTYETVGIICITAGISFIAGWIMAKHDSEMTETVDHLLDNEKHSNPERYKCCMHCVDPTTGNYTSPHFGYSDRSRIVPMYFDEHILPCTEVGCFKGNSVVSNDTTKH